MKVIPLNLKVLMHTLAPCLSHALYPAARDSIAFSCYTCLNIHLVQRDLPILCWSMYKYCHVNCIYMDMRSQPFNKAISTSSLHKYTSRFFLNGCRGLIWHSTIVATASWSTVEGTLKLLHTRYSCLSSCSVPSTVKGIWMCISLCLTLILNNNTQQLDVKA